MTCFLGFDSSTQGLKATIIDVENGNIVHETAVNFGNDLPEYSCPEGFLVNDKPLIVQTPPLLWAAALDLALCRMRDEGAPLSDVAGVSGSGQQHGSVYLNGAFGETLASLNRNATLAEQLEHCFSRSTSPIWMDRSTRAECMEFDKRFGDLVRSRTGSPAVERFTGPQIRKFFKEEPESYAATQVIHLVSSFMCSLLIGKSAPVDFGDGAGMNLLNLQTGCWDSELVEFAAPGLMEKLPPVVNSSRTAGQLSAYFEKYGLRKGIPVIVWSGDNPNSLIGCGAHNAGSAVISLGTSDTFFAAMAGFKTDPAGYGHVFGNPAGGFMSLSCFSNGSLARDRIREHCGVDWGGFDRLIETQSAPGNNGNMLLPYFVAESTPLVLDPAVKYAGSSEFAAGRGTAAELSRAVLESQVYSFKLHSEWIGAFEQLRITGGASRSIALRQIIADVFECPVETFQVSNSAGLGAALRAAEACGAASFDELSQKFVSGGEVTLPRAEYSALYRQAVNDYRALEKDFTD